MGTRKLIAGFLAATLLVLAVAGCGTKTESVKPADATETPKKAPVSLTVWTNFNETEVAELQKTADEWAKKTGNKVTVANNQGGFQEFATAAQSGTGPDVLYGLPHDNLGSFWKAGLLAEVPAEVLKQNDYVPLTVNAVSFDGKAFALPIGMEAIALFYNTDLVKEAPKDWDSFLTIAKKDGFMFNVKEPYFSFGFIAGNGGYIFKDKGGGLDIKDIGLGNAGAIAGMQMVKDMIHTWKLMPKDVDYEIPKGKFQAGKLAFWLTGSWEVTGLQEAKVPFAVAPMPDMAAGKPFRPFVGVQTGFVSKESKNQAEAWDLMSFLQSKVDDFTIKTGARIPVTTAGLNRADFKSNKILAAFSESAKNGIPMPNVPEMQAVWPAFAQAMQVIAAGDVEPAAAAEMAVKLTTEGIANLK